MRNKKGFLLLEENSINLVLAVMGLILVIIVIVYLFNALTTNQIKKNVQISLDILENKTNSLADGETTIAKLPGLCKGNDCTRFIAGWSKNDNGEKAPPEQYLLKNVVCVCNGVINNPSYYTYMRLACSVANSCREIKDVSQIIVGPDTILTTKGGYMGARIDAPVEYPVINFHSNLLEVEISKNNGVVTFKKKV